MECNWVPSERLAIIGEVVGITHDKQDASDIRKKEEFAPESETTVHGEGVLGNKGESISSVKLDKITELTLTDEGFPNTRSSYLMVGRTHLAEFPPHIFEVVAVKTCPEEGFLHDALEWAQ